MGYTLLLRTNGVRKRQLVNPATIRDAKKKIKYL